MKILLVDDDEVIRLGMRKLIDKAGKDWSICGEVSDGAMALDFLSANPNVDLIICDVRMPIMDGLELTAAIRERGLGFPKIIMLSGYNDFEYVRSAFMNGACDYILKPFKKDELLSLIEKVELQIKDELREKQTADENNDFIVTEILKKLPDCNEKEAADYLLRLKDLGVNTDKRYKIAVQIAADQYYRQFSQKAQYNKALAEIHAVIENYTSKKSPVETLSCIGEKEILMLLFSDDKDTIMDHARELFEYLNNFREDTISVTFGISEIITENHLIPMAFSQSNRAIMGRFYLGQKQFIKFSTIKSKITQLQYDVQPAINDLSHSMTMSDFSGARKALEQVFIDLSYCPEDSFRRCIHEILDGLCLKADSFSAFYAASANEIAFCVDYLNTYRELKTYLNTLLKNAIEYLDSEKEKKSQRRIEMSKDYIEGHYSEPFSLNDIADYVELNPSYFSNLFRTQTGVTFSEYLLNVRMEKAKELLKDPKIKIYEIGNLVGYEDAVSFGRAFKKKWGISPKEYRNSVY